MGTVELAALRVASTLKGQLRVSPDYVTIRLAADGVHLVLRPGAQAPVNPDPAVPLVIEHADVPSALQMEAWMTRLNAATDDPAVSAKLGELEVSGFGPDPMSGTIRFEFRRYDPEKVAALRLIFPGVPISAERTG